MAKALYEFTAAEWQLLTQEELQAVVDHTNSLFAGYQGDHRDEALGEMNMYERAVVDALRKGFPVPARVSAQQPLFSAVQFEMAYGAWGPNLDTSLRARRGFAIRMDDGTPVTQSFRAQVAEAMTSVEDALHIGAPLWRKVGLTIIGAGDGHAFGQPSAAGCFTPEEMTITLGAGDYEEGPPLQSLAHEVAHLLDCRRRGRLGLELRDIYHSRISVDRVAKDADAQRETRLYQRARATMTFDCSRYRRDCACQGAPDRSGCDLPRDLLEYGGLPEEVFARLAEQYVALRTPGPAVATLPFHLYCTEPFFWSRRAFGDMAKDVGQALERRRANWLRRSWPIPWDERRGNAPRRDGAV